MTGPYPGYGQQPEQTPPNYGPPLRQPDPGYAQPQYAAPPAQYGAQPAYDPAAAQPTYDQQQQQYPQQQMPAYGAPAYGSGNTSFARSDSRGFGIVGAVFAVIGAIAGIIAFTALDWSSKGGGHAHFGDIHTALKSSGDIGQPVAKLYFAWLAWTLLAAGFVIALLACLPSPVSGGLRGLGLLIGLVGIGFTFWGINLIKHGIAYSYYIKHSGIGFWFAVGGFLFLAIGSLIGPRRRTT